MLLYARETKADAFSPEVSLMTLENNIATKTCSQDTNWNIKVDSLVS